jgi:hypothetical protein
MLTTALPVAAWAVGKSAVAEDRIAGRAKPTPMPPISCSAHAESLALHAVT